MDDQRALIDKSSSTKPISAGIRVLVVDDDATCLKIVEVMLKKFQYEAFILRNLQGAAMKNTTVVSVRHASDALAILWERQGGFDIILTDLHMPEMDGIALLEHVEIEFKIPVVMMSSNDKEIIASRCLESGAAFFLTKPLAGSDISNLWQYVYLKKRDETIAIEQIGSDSDLPTPEKVSEEDTQCASSVNEGNWRQESRKKFHTKKEQNKERSENDGVSQKKSRVVWNNGLHNKFLDAIDQIGLDRAVPTKILDLMNHQGLTRENVASHLQKYRIFLRRLREVSRSSEPSAFRSLTTGCLKLSSASLLPSPVLRLEQGFSGISEQQHAHKSFQPGLKVCSTSQLEVENPLPTGNHNNLKLPSLDMISSVNQQNNGTYSSFQMESSNIIAGSSLYGDIPNNLASNSDTLVMIHQQPQARMGHFALGSLDHSFNTTSLPSDNIQNVGSMPSLNNLNQAASNFSHVNNGFSGIQMNSSRLDEIRKGKMPLVDTGRSPPIPGLASSHFDYAAQGLASSTGFMLQGLAPPGGLVSQGSISSSGFASTTPFSPIPTNVNQQLPLLPIPPPPPPQQPPENDIEVAEELDGILELMKNNFDTEIGKEDSIFELMKKNSPFRDFSFEPSFDEHNLSDMLLKPVDQSPNLQEACGEAMDPGFNTNDGFSHDADSITSQFNLAFI